LTPTPPTGDIACAASPIAEQARQRPALEPVDRDREKLDVVPALDIADAEFKDRRHPHDFIEHRGQAPRLHRIELPLGDDIGALPVIATIECHHHPAGIDAGEHILGLVGTLAGANQNTSIGAPISSTGKATRARAPANDARRRRP
jgi:hypothetical protein